MTYPTIEHVLKTTAFKYRKHAEGAIEALIWLEAGAPHQLDGLKGRFNFDMSEFLDQKTEWVEEGEFGGADVDCGTICCIAGAIHAFSKGMNGDNRHVKNAGELDEIFGVNRPSHWWSSRSDRAAKYQPLAQLFYAISEDGDQVYEGQLEKITPADAAVTLRRYLETGVVDWSHVNAGK